MIVLLVRVDRSLTETINKNKSAYGRNEKHMKKRIFSLLLAVTLVFTMLAVTACKDDDSLPPSGDGTNAPAGTSGSGGDQTNAPADTNAPDAETPVTNEFGLLRENFEDYMPDDDARYKGKVGFAVSGAMIDDFRVTKSSNNNMIENDFESSSDLPEGLWTTISGALSDWSVAEDGENHALTSANPDSVITVGNTKWAPYKLVAKIKLEEEGEARLYFCMTDENNYYYVSVTGTRSALHQVADGTDTKLYAFDFKCPVGEWFSCTANVTREEVVIYVNGIDIFYINGSDQVTHTYSGMFGISQWGAEFYVDNIKIEDINTGDILFFEDFESGTGFIDNARFGNRNGGNWNVANTADWEIIELDDGNHVLHYKVTSTKGSTILFDGNIGDGKSAYRFTYDGYKVSGSEGYPCVWDCDPDSVDGEGNLADYYGYCHGGWSGKSGVQVVIGGELTNYQNSVDIGLVTGKWQTVETQLYPNCILNLFHDDFVQVFYFQ